MHQRVKLAQMAFVDRAGGLAFVVGGSDEPSNYYSCTVFCAMMQLGDKLQFGRLVVCVLGSFAVKRQNLIGLGRSYSLKA